MKNKVSTINGAIDQCKRLMKNETIVLNGLHTFHITRGELTNGDLQNRINELQRESAKLYERINRLE